MSIIEKVFHYGETGLPVIEYKDEIWFIGKTVAEIIGYAIQHKAILDHVDHEDKRKLSELVPKSKQNETEPLKYRGSKMEPLTNNQKNTININESGLYCLILHFKLESERAFKRWVTKDVLPSIRKTRNYSYDDMNHKYNDSLTFKIENETDLHTKVVSFLKKRYPNSIFTATLGENQDTSKKRIDSYKKGYLRGSPLLMNDRRHILMFVTKNIQKNYAAMTKLMLMLSPSNDSCLRLNSLQIEFFLQLACLPCRSSRSGN